MHGIVADCVANLKRVGQISDFGEALLDLYSSLLNTLGLCLHQVERIATLTADTGLQSSNSVLEKGVADVTDTRRVVIVLIIVGKCAPLGPGVNNAITNLPDVSNWRKNKPGA